VAVIFAVLAGGKLFGFLGMLLALPVAAVVNVLLRYAQERYTHSRLYAGAHPEAALGVHASAPAAPAAPATQGGAAGAATAVAAHPAIGDAERS
jgi:hypothetical protein